MVTLVARLAAIGARIRAATAAAATERAASGAAAATASNTDRLPACAAATICPSTHLPALPVRLPDLLPAYVRNQQHGFACRRRAAALPRDAALGAAPR